MRDGATNVVGWAILGAFIGVSALAVVWTQTIGAGPITYERVARWAGGGALVGALLALLRR